MNNDRLENISIESINIANIFPLVKESCLKPQKFQIKELEAMYYTCRCEKYECCCDGNDCVY